MTTWVTYISNRANFRWPSTTGKKPFFISRMKLIHSLYKRKSKTQKADCIKLFIVILLLGILSCTAHQQAKGFPDYESFVQTYSKTAPTIAEIYGQYSAEQS